MAFDFPPNPTLDTLITFPEGASYRFDGVTWQRLATASPAAGGEVWVEEAPMDGTPYTRQDGAWVPAVAGGGVEEAPIDSTPYMRRDQAWVPGDLMTADRPILNTISPSTAAVSVTTPVTVTLTGSKFSVTGKIYFGNKLMPSHFISPSSMSFPLIPSEQTVGPHVVTISNGGLISQPRTFTIT